jgi:hypothetical protein
MKVKIESDGTIESTKVFTEGGNKLDRLLSIQWGMSRKDNNVPTGKIEMHMLPCQVIVEADILVTTLDGKRYKLVPLENEGNA